MAKVEVIFSVFFLIIVAFGGEPDDDTPVQIYTKETFKDQIENDPHFVLFYAPWCGHCQKVLPTWKQLTEQHSTGEEKVKIIQVDCTKNTDVCADYNIRGYPTMKFFSGKETDPVTFKGGRDLETFEEFIKKQTESGDQEPLTPEPEVKTGLYELTDDTFQKHVEHGDHFIKFYAPWCGHCQRLAPAWAELATFHSENADVKISKVDCTENRPLCQKHSVRAYPTLLWFRNGVQYEKFQGSRDLNSLRDYVKQKSSETPQDEDAEKIPTTHTPKPPKGNVAKLSTADFESTIASGVTFVKFYVDWCGHCKAIAPVFEDLGKFYSSSGSSIKIAEVNCDENSEICQKKQVQGYPTIILFKNGEQVEEYSGGRTLDSFKGYLTAHAPHDEL